MKDVNKDKLNELQIEPDFLPVNSLTLMQLAAMTPNKYNISVLDNPTSIKTGEKYDIVGITFVTSAAIDAYKIADIYKKEKAFVILGGPHASALPEEAIKHSDAVMIGEAEGNWLKFLEDLEKKETKKFYKTMSPPSLENIPFPKRDIFTQESPIAPIQATRGCPHGCEFCTITNKRFGNIPRFRNIKDLIEEIKTIPQEYLFFCDSSLTINPEYTKKLFKQMKNLDKTLLMCNGNVDVLAKDEELLKLASEAGCLEWLVGFESISQDSLNEVGKKTNKVEYYKPAIKKIHDYGMELIGEFIFGFDSDTKKTINDTYDMIQEMDIDLPAPGVLTPYPGTRLYERLDSENRILTRDWSKYSERNVVFKPKLMSAEELSELADSIYEKLFKSHLYKYRKRRYKIN